MRRAFRILALSFTVVTVVAALALIWSTPVAASAQYPTGGYWYAEFFDARWPSARPIHTRYDANINFDWGTGSPDPAVPADNFSARWTRTVDLVGGNYRFWVIHDDGVLLWVDEQLVINQWYDQPAFIVDTGGVVHLTAHYGEIALTPGPHKIKLEYYEHGKNATVKMGWETMMPDPCYSAVETPSTLKTDTIHTVRPGEWLYKIARAYGVEVTAIVDANGLTSLQVVPGQQLAIPGVTPVSNTSAPAAASAPAMATSCRTYHIVKSGENLFRVALKYNTSVSAVAAQNGMRAPYTVHVGQSLCVP
jgi:LysM repeat protein